MTAPFPPRRPRLDLDRVRALDGLAGSDYDEGVRFPGYPGADATTDAWHWRYDAHEDGTAWHDGREADDAGWHQRAEAFTLTPTWALAGSTWCWTVLGTIICAVATMPLLFPYLIAGGVVVGTVVGLVMAGVVASVTTAASTPLTAEAFRRRVTWCFRGLVVATIGLGCAALVIGLAIDAMRYPKPSSAGYVALGVAYAAYLVTACWLVAGWVGPNVADRHLERTLARR